MTRSQQHAVGLGPLAKKLREAALSLIWRQWRAVGAQTTAGERADSIVDPEALILISLTLMREEVRLTDLMNDWVAVNSDLLSVQRVNNLSAAYPATSRERLSRIAGVALERGKDSRWRSLVMRSSGGGAAPNDPPSSRTDKKRAIRPRFVSPATLMLQLRLGLGVGAKADVLAFLLATEGSRTTVREIASATSYTAATVRRAAEDMAAARMIHGASGQPVTYRADRAGWTKILGLTGGSPTWRGWHYRFLFVIDFLECAQELTAFPTSHYAAGVKGRELLERHRSAFEQDQVAVWNEHTPVADWLTFLEAAVGALVKWMNENA